MSNGDSEVFSHSKLKKLRGVWSSPDEKPGFAWDFDGVVDADHWMSYNNELKDGLATFGCNTFDELVLLLGKKLGRKPNVIDLMGGAYFLHQPENTNTLTGIRVHDKDDDFARVHKGSDLKISRLVQKITGASNRKVVEADVLSNNGWNKIKEADLPLADLLICRPVGPFDNKRAMAGRFDREETYAGLYISLFNRMLSLVNNGGVVFTEVPDIFSNAQIEEFASDVKRRKEFEVSIFEVPDGDYKWGGVKRRYLLVKLVKN